MRCRRKGYNFCRDNILTPQPAMRPMPASSSHEFTSQRPPSSRHRPSGEAAFVLLRENPGCASFLQETLAQ